MWLSKNHENNIMPSGNESEGGGGYSSPSPSLNFRNWKGNKYSAINKYDKFRHLLKETKGEIFPKSKHRMMDDHDDFRSSRKNSPKKWERMKYLQAKLNSFPREIIKRCNLESSQNL